MKNIKKLIKLADERVDVHIELDKKTWIANHSIDVYKKWLIWEIEEAFEEIKENNSVYLEDELWDIFWTYITLLQGLQKRWYIKSVEKVFERSFDKFNGRLDYVIKNNYENSWKEIKDIQKIKRKKEHEEKYWIKI